MGSPGGDTIAETTKRVTAPAWQPAENVFADVFATCGIVHVTRGSKDVLEDVLDKEAGLKPKLVTQPAGVGSPISGSPISGSPIPGSAIRHIPQADLDAFINGQLAGPRLDFCRTHLDSCEECRAELEDLRNFKSSQAGLSIGGSLRRELDRRKRQKQLKAAATAAAVTVVVATVAAVGWFEFVKPRLHGAAASGAAAAPARNVAQATASAGTQTSASVVAMAQQATTTQPTATAQPRGTAIASAQQPVAQPRTAAMAASNQAAGAPQAAIQSHGTASATATTQGIGTARSAAQTVSAMAPAAKSAAAMQAVGTQAARTQAAGTQAAGTQAAGTQAAGTAQPARQAVNTSQARAVQAPAVQAAAVQAPAMATAAAVAPAASTTFALLGPFGDEISDDRPEFTWQPLAGATKYAVILVDEGLRPVAHTRVKTTSWRPRKPLRRGRTYLWQVTAILRNGTKVIGTGPTSVEARIHIAPPSGKHSDK